MPLRLRQPAVLSLLNRLLRYPPSINLLPLSHSRSLQISFFPPTKRPQPIPPVDSKMLNPLLVSEGGNWKVSKDGFALERDVTFDTFADTKKFIDAVCTKAQFLRHHPEWANIYNYVFIRLRTHKDMDTGAQGISTLDLKLAHFCDDEIQLHNGTYPSRMGRGRVLLKELMERKEAANEHSAVRNEGSRDGSAQEYIGFMGKESEESGDPVHEPVTARASQKGLLRDGREGMVEDQEDLSSGAKADRKSDHDPATKARMQDELRDNQRSMKRSDDQLDLAATARIDDEVRTIVRRSEKSDVPVDDPVTPPTWQEGSLKLGREGMVEAQDRKQDQEGLSSEVEVNGKGNIVPPTKEEELRTDLRSMKQPDDQPTEEGDVANCMTWMLWRQRAAVLYSGPHSWNDLLLDAEKHEIPKEWAKRQLHDIATAFEASSSSSSSPSARPDGKAEGLSHTDHSASGKETNVPGKKQAIASEKIGDYHRLWLDRARMGIHKHNVPRQKLHEEAVMRGLGSEWAWEQLAKISATNPTRKGDEKKSPSSASSSSPPSDKKPLFIKKSKTDKLLARNRKTAKKHAKQAAAKAAFIANVREAARAAEAAKHNHPNEESEPVDPSRILRKPLDEGYEPPDTPRLLHKSHPISFQTSSSYSEEPPSLKPTASQISKSSNQNARNSESKTTRHRSPPPPEPMRSPGNVPLGLPSSLMLDGAGGGSTEGRLGGGGSRGWLDGANYKARPSGGREWDAIRRGKGKWERGGKGR